MTVRAPAARPCGSCPYRRDVPSGVWHPDEYAKLPAYDHPTAEQPVGVFCCHQQPDRLCAGWVAVHDMVESLGLRIALAAGKIAGTDAVAVYDYRTDVPLFPSGAAAAEHGLRRIADPDVQARRVIDRLEPKLRRRAGS